MVEWPHQLNGHEFEQTLGDREGQGSSVCCSSWRCKESDMIKQLNDNHHHHVNIQLTLQQRFELCELHIHGFFFNNKYYRDFPGIPVVKTSCYHCRGCRFNPWSGN